MLFLGTTKLGSLARTNAFVHDQHVTINTVLKYGQCKHYLNLIVDTICFKLLREIQ